MRSNQPGQPGFVGPRLVAGALLAFSLLALYQVFQIRQGAGYSVVGTVFFPVLVVVGLLMLSVILFLRTSLFPDYVLAEQAAAEEARTHWLTVGLAALALVVYALLLRPLGYILATALFFPGVARVLDSRRPVRDFVVGLVLSVIVYFSFTRFLGVRLPGGVLAGIL